MTVKNSSKSREVGLYLQRREGGITGRLLVCLVMDDPVILCERQAEHYSVNFKVVCQIKLDVCLYNFMWECFP